MRQRPVFQVGVDLLDDRVAAVGLLGLDQQQWAVGDHGVVAVEAEQLLLIRAVSRAAGLLGLRVEAFHAAHDQAAGDVVGLGSAGERGVVDLGDLCVADQALLLVVPDRVGIANRGPGSGSIRPIAAVTAGFILAVMENRTFARRAAAITWWL